jgi:hypothetical protein
MEFKVQAGEFAVDPGVFSRDSKGVVLGGIERKGRSGAGGQTARGGVGPFQAIMGGSQALAVRAIARVRHCP